LNGVLYIYYIILCSEIKEINEKDKKINGEKRNPLVYQYMDLYANKYKNNNKKLYDFDCNLNGNVILNDKERVIRLIYLFKIWTWFLKYFAYIIYMILEDVWLWPTYISIFISIIDYYQYFFMKMYYFVIMRTKNILQNFLLYETDK
jgi:hypothetical protein